MIGITTHADASINCVYIESVLPDRYQYKLCLTEITGSQRTFLHITSVTSHSSCFGIRTSIIFNSALIHPWQSPSHCQCVVVGVGHLIHHSLRGDSSCCCSISCPGDSRSKTTSGDTGQGEHWWGSIESWCKTEFELACDGGCIWSG